MKNIPKKSPTLYQVVKKNGDYEYRKYKNKLLIFLNKLFCFKHAYKTYVVEEFIFKTAKRLCCKCGVKEDDI